MSENDLRTAARCLDLSDLKPAERDANAHLLAGKLLLVMRRYEVVVLQRIPDEPELEGPYKYLISRYGRIELERQVAGDRDGEWLFSATTVSSIERLYKGWETRPVLPELRDAPGLSFFTLPALWLREHIIPPYLKRAALGWEYWQWLGAALVLVVGVLVQRIARVILPWVARRLLPAREFTPDPNLLRPITLLALVATWWGGIQLLDLGAKATGVLWPALRLVLIVLGAWALYRLIDLLSAYSVARPRRGETRLNDVLVPLVRKTLKVVIVAVGATMVLTAVGFEVGPLLAGLGLGGLAFSFAAKDTIANFFGSVNVVLDRPFQVGDYVKIGIHEGTVESVGLRSSRLRTFHDSQLTIPNAELMTAVIDNLGRRRFRRTHATLAVSHAATPEQLEAFCEGIRELIRRHPHTRKENYHVSVSALTATTVEITLYCFHECPDWGSELQERHRLLVDVVRLARRLGVEFASVTPVARGAVAGTGATGSAPQLAATDAVRVGREQAAAIASVPADRPAE
jgi:MscS family membrane protein